MARLEAIQRANALARRLAAVLGSPLLTDDERGLGRRYASRFDTSLDELDEAVTKLEQQVAKRARVDAWVAA